MGSDPILRKLIFILFILLAGLNYYGQEPNDSLSFKPQFRRGVHYSMETSTGVMYSGFVAEETKEYVTLEDRISHEKTVIKKSEIVHVKLLPLAKGLPNVPFGENEHARNYLFAGSAFLFREGKASTNAHWLLLENIDYAFTDNWAVSLNTLAFYPFTIGIKCSYALNELDHIGASVFGIGNITSGNSNSILIGYGALARFTRGTSNKNFTVSGGLIGVNSDMFLGVRNTPFVNVGFVSAAYCNRFSERVALNLESWYIPVAKTGLGGIGFKFVGDDVTCWSVGCYALLNNFNNTVRINVRTIPIPYFGVSRIFD